MAKQFITSFNDDDWYIWDVRTRELVAVRSGRTNTFDEILERVADGQAFGKGFDVKNIPIWREVPDVTRKAVAYTNGATELQQVVTPIAALPGQFSVSYGSQYFGAKNPEGLHRKLQFVTDEAGLKRLAENLLSFCNTR